MAKVKTTREEYRRFCESDIWEDEMYIGYSEFQQNNVTIEDEEDLEEGVCYLIEGSIAHESNGKSWSLVSLFHKWRKQQDTVSLTILVKKDEIVEMKAKLKTLGVIIL